MSGMDWLHVREIADEAFEERNPACRVDRFEDDASAGTDLVERETQHLRQIGGLEMLDNLHSDQPAE